MPAPKIRRLSDRELASMLNAETLCYHSRVEITGSFWPNPDSGLSRSGLSIHLFITQTFPTTRRTRLSPATTAITSKGA
jgi:hypothetical protein